MKGHLLVGLVIAAGLTLSAVLSGGEANAAQSSVTTGSIGRDGFWAIVDHAAAFKSKPREQLNDLRKALARLTPEQIVEFDNHRAELMARSFSYDLWGAAYVANGGASDDGFEYFRSWLIAEGRLAYEAVIADPDNLAAVAPKGRGRSRELEEFAYVAGEVWVARTGRPLAEMPVKPVNYPLAPTGVTFLESRTALARRYPKLWKRFG